MAFDYVWTLRPAAAGLPDDTSVTMRCRSPFARPICDSPTSLTGSRSGATVLLPRLQTMSSVRWRRGGGKGGHPAGSGPT